MKSTKKAGIERPYTCREFVKIIETTAKRMQVKYLDQIDYLIGDDGEMDFVDAEIVSETRYGSSEGIYSTFWVYKDGKRDIQIATAKTLGTSNKDWLDMNALAAHICLISNIYISQHYDEFNWSGYTVKSESDDSFSCFYCYSIENAKKYAEVFRKQGQKPVIIDNKTRKEVKE